jgi:thiol-disulfide isomerase/thioredoxin
MAVKPLSGILCFVGLILLQNSGAMAGESGNVHRFDSGSYRTILEQRQGQPFVMALWSLDCVHCYAELELLGRLAKAHTDFNLVLVSTDSFADLNEIRQVIEQHGLQDIPQWIFAEPASQRLRFEIDPHWYGELPRNYFFDARHSRRAKSGALTQSDLAEIISAPTGTRTKPASSITAKESPN